MFTVKNTSNTIVINKSKFITDILSIDSIDDVVNYLDIIKDKYKDANHYCYAYILDNVKRFNDDGEPSGTAGMPILDCLEKNNLNHVLCVVTRYFGCTKLGAGNLTRAYSNSTSSVINNTKFLKLIDGYEVVITFPYNRIKEIDNILSNYKIIEKKFNNNVIYNAYIDKDVINKLNDVDIKIKKEIVIKKEI